jgi:hypothetical protein
MCAGNQLKHPKYAEIGVMIAIRKWKPKLLLTCKSLASLEFPAC